MSDSNDSKNSLFSHEMELSREIEYLRRNKQLRRICREYNLTQKNVNEKFLSRDILLNSQYKVRNGKSKFLMSSIQLWTISTLGGIPTKADQGFPFHSYVSLLLKILKS